MCIRDRCCLSSLLDIRIRRIGFIRKQTQRYMANTWKAEMQQRAMRYLTTLSLALKFLNDEVNRKIYLFVM